MKNEAQLSHLAGEIASPVRLQGAEAARAAEETPTMRLRARTCLALTALHSALPIGAQPAVREDRDLELLPVGRYDTVDRVTPVDTETDEVGRLVVAYGLDDSYYGTASVEVRMGDKNAVGWAELASPSIDSGPGAGTRVKAVSVATGVKLNGTDMNDMAFVAVVLSRGGSDYLA